MGRCVGLPAHSGKLSQLAKPQFDELATDVCDEVQRRRTIAAGLPAPSQLAVEANYQPTRNEARQKLASFNNERFKDLALDIVVELGRRAPLALETVTPELDVGGLAGSRAPGVKAGAASTGAPGVPVTAASPISSGNGSGVVSQRRPSVSSGPAASGPRSLGALWPARPWDTPVCASAEL